ncbi:MFS transporter [Sphingomonas sp.]|jgi:MHS family proline/betaine transporter-like MFS transporter|uniref:MFS transporter n=1 Tax=Sphingomonas sp. TaxID=28214 RepID=UPI002DE46AF8|nr:MFS transporter [Sphingomonas sp.]HEV2568071.1 MFS transporter [Sphingomonas sp.]
MAIAACSTVVEWYDFTLYLYMATLLSRVLFGPGEASLAATLGGFAVAYLMRPLGALVFGHIGDRYGRRRTMLASMVIMTAAMLATALLPTYAALGSSAGLLLLLLRCVMGFSVGGEYTGVVAYLLEGAARERRGLVTSFAAMASEIGALLAAGVAAITVSTFEPAALEAWGWRIPFFIGAALAGSVLLARSTMQESPEFERQQERGTVPQQPLRFALQYRSAIARGFAISALGSITYYVGITYVPAFLSQGGSLSERDALWLSTLAAFVVILVTPLIGLLTDKIGRKPVLLLLCIAAALLPATMFAWMAGASDARVLVGAVVLAAMGGGVSAVGAVTTAELFPGEGRLSGLAWGATAATAIFGGFTPYLAQRFTALTGSPMAPGFMIAAVALAVLPVLLTMPETRPRKPVA